MAELHAAGRPRTATNDPVCDEGQLWDLSFLLYNYDACIPFYALGLFKLKLTDCFMCCSGSISEYLSN